MCPATAQLGAIMIDEIYNNLSGKLVWELWPENHQKAFVLAFCPKGELYKFPEKTPPTPEDLEVLTLIRHVFGSRGQDVPLFIKSAFRKIAAIDKERFSSTANQLRAGIPQNTSPADRRPREVL